MLTEDTLYCMAYIQCTTSTKLHGCNTANNLTNLNLESLETPGLGGSCVCTVDYNIQVFPKILKFLQSAKFLFLFDTLFVSFFFRYVVRLYVIPCIFLKRIQNRKHLTYVRSCHHRAASTVRDTALCECCIVGLSSLSR